MGALGNKKRPLGEGLLCLAERVGLIRPLCGLTPLGRTVCVQNRFAILLNQWVQTQHPVRQTKKPLGEGLLCLAERVGFEPTKGY